MRRLTEDGFGLAAAAIAAGQAGFELIRLIFSHGSMDTRLPPSTYASSAIFIGVLSFAAVALALRRAWGYTLGLVGVVVLLAEGAILLVHPGATVGAAYVLWGFVLAFCLAKSMPSVRAVA
jgi:hypothetical protein